MLTTDQSHLRKYLATLGVAVFAGVISLSGLFFRLQNDLLIKQSDLDDLTPAARETIERRQAYLEAATTILPWFLIIGCLMGLGLTAYGLAGWARRQSVADEIENIARDKGKTELRKLTDAERVQRLEDEAASAVAEDDESVQAAVKADGAGAPNPEAAEQPSVTVDDRHQRTTEAFQRMVQAELDIGHKLGALLGSRYRIELGVQASRGAARQEFDILARPTEAGLQYVFEIKYTRQLTSAHRSMLDRAISQAAAGARLFERPTVPVVVFVYESATPAGLARVRAHGEQLAQSFDSAPRVLILSAHELEELAPEVLGNLIGL